MPHPTYTRGLRRPNYAWLEIMLLWILRSTMDTISEHMLQPTSQCPQLIVAIIKTVLKAFLTQSTERDNTLHASSVAHPEIHLWAVAQVHALYSLSPHILPSDQQLFTTPLDTLLTKPTKTLQLFVNHNKDIVKKSLLQQRRQTKRTK